MRISDWSSDVCSSDLLRISERPQGPSAMLCANEFFTRGLGIVQTPLTYSALFAWATSEMRAAVSSQSNIPRSEEHTSELQSLMRISYAVFCLKKKTQQRSGTSTHDITKTNNNRKSITNL